MSQLRGSRRRSRTHPSRPGGCTAQRCRTDTSRLGRSSGQGSGAAQLLGGVETAVGVWQEESGAVSPTFNACDATSVSRSQPTRWLYDSQSAGLNVVNSSVRIWVSVLSVWFGIGWASSGCGSIGWKRVGRRRACRGHAGALATSGSVACGMPRWGTLTDQSRSRATLTKASSAGE